MGNRDNFPTWAQALRFSEDGELVAAPDFERMNPTNNLFASVAGLALFGTVPHGGNATNLAIFMKFPTIKYEGPGGDAVTRATGNAAGGSCRFGLDTRPLKSAESGALFIKYGGSLTWIKWARPVQAAPGRRSVVSITGKHFIERPGRLYIHHLGGSIRFSRPCNDEAVMVRYVIDEERHGF